MTTASPYKTMWTSAIVKYLVEAKELDNKFRSAGISNERSTPWMPFNLNDFIMMLSEALPEAEEHTFLDIGCGPGSKMIVAENIFGLRSAGFDIAGDLVQEADSRGLSVWTSDALDWDHYGEYGIIWFNRVFRDQELQADLEHKIWNDAAPGTVVICAHLNSPPPSSWWVVLDDWEARRGVWKKPGTR